MITGGFGDMGLLRRWRWRCFDFICTIVCATHLERRVCVCGGFELQRADEPAHEPLPIPMPHVIPNIFCSNPLHMSCTVCQ